MGILFRLFLVQLLVIFCESYPDGAPSTACSTLTPRHQGNEPQRSSPPYTIHAVKSGDKIRVTISSPIGENFQGFVLQARASRDNSRIVDGVFTHQNGVSKTIDCGDGTQNTLTQASPSTKNTLITEWTPADGVNEEVVFKATVAQTFSRFWTNIYSSSIGVRNIGGGSTRRQESTTRRQEDDMSSGNIYDGCSVTKGCFGYPIDCVSDRSCDVLVSYASEADGIYLKISGPLEQRSYMAMGISEDKSMGDDSVTECFLQNGRVIARESVNIRKSNTPIREIPEGMYEWQTKDGLTSCSWTKPYSSDANGKKFNLANTTYYMFVAKGPMSSGRLEHHVGKISTATKVNFTAFEYIESEGVTDSIKIHGTFMVTAWVGLVSLAILLARYFKTAWENHTLFGVKIWFAFHRGLMLLAMLFVAVAFIVIFVHKDGWNYETKNPHAILGCIATAFGLFQPIMALFRPAPDDPKRPIFNWLHWAVGNAAQIIAVVTIFFAVSLQTSGLKESFYWVMAIFVIVHCIFYLLFQLHNWTTQKKNEVKMLEMNTRGNTTNIQNNFQEKQFTGNVFRVLLLGIYGIFLAVIMMALYALIGVA